MEAGQAANATSAPHARIVPVARGWHVTPPLTGIRGREEDVAAVAALLDSPSVRLVTLTGPGGVGKTRLAQELALTLQDEFADGACFVPFASVRNASHATPALLRALDLRPAGTGPLDTFLIDALRDRHVLLVLDNLEHLADTTAPLIAEVLQQCPRLTMLVTSRLPLRIAGEHRYLLDPLDVPPERSDIPVDTRSASAVQLFVERAHAVDPSFILTSDNRSSVVRMCRMLDGLPLAIELAAARIRLMPPGELADRLDGHMTALASDRIDLPDRHRTMGAVFAWSYDMLEPDQQRLLRWLSVFPGGFTLEAAQVVGRALDIRDTEASLLGLVEHSLVQRREIARDRYRFGMLEVVREFGLTELETKGDTGRAIEAMAGYILQLGREAGIGLYGPSQGVWLDRLEAERDNLQAVFAWLLELGRVADAAELAVNTIPFRGIRGYSSQDLPLLEELLAHPGLAEKEVPRAHALVAVAVARRTTMAVGSSVDAIEEALPIYRRAGDRMRVARALQHEIIALLGMGSYQRARDAAEECIQLGRELGLREAEAVGVMYLGALAWLEGRVDDTRAYFRKVRSIPQEELSPEFLGLQLYREAQMHHSLGDYDAAERCILESVAWQRKNGSKASSPSAYEMLGRIAHLREDFDAARRYYDQGMQLATDTGNAGMANEIASFAAELEKDMGHLDVAIRDMRRYIVDEDFDRYPHGLGSALDQYTDLAIRAGDLAQAARFMGAADAVYGGKGIRRWPGLSSARREQREVQLRKALGDTAFERTHAAGQGLAADAAVDEMLTWQPDRQPTEPQPPQELPEGLTSRELEALKLMADGLTNQEIADSLGVSHRTAAAHAGNIMGKLGVSSRTGAVAYAIRNGLA